MEESTERKGYEAWLRTKVGRFLFEKMGGVSSKEQLYTVFLAGCSASRDQIISERIEEYRLAIEVIDRAVDSVAE